MTDMHANIFPEASELPEVRSHGGTTWIRIGDEVAIHPPNESASVWLRALSDAALKLAVEYEAEAHH